MAAKKSFSEDLNPALAFISTEESPAETGAQTQGTVQQALHGERAEAKSRRVQMLIKPSTYERVKGQAQQLGVSVNAYMNAILEHYTKGKP